MNTQTQKLIDQLISLQKDRNQELQEENNHSQNLLLDLKKLKLENETKKKKLLIQKKTTEGKISAITNQTIQFEIPITEINLEVKQLNRELIILQQEKKELELQYHTNLCNFEIAKIEKINQLKEKLTKSDQQIQVLFLKLEGLEQEGTKQEQKSQQQIDLIETELDKLLFEFQTYGNLRLLHRNKNLNHLMIFKKQIEDKMSHKKKLEHSLLINQQQLKNIKENNKLEHQSLLILHNQKLSKATETDSFKSEYIECENEVKTLLKKHQQKIKKYERQYTLLSQEIQELDLNIQNLQFQKKEQIKIHPPTLKNIKLQKQKIKQHQANLQIELLEIQNKKNTLVQQINECKLHKTVLLDNMTLEKNAKYWNKSLVHSILDKNIEIQNINQRIKYYITEKKKSEITTQKKIELHHFEIENHQRILDTLSPELDRINEKINHLSQKEKIMNIKLTTKNQKRLKDTNQKLLQELASLAKIIN